MCLIVHNNGAHSNVAVRKAIDDHEEHAACLWEQVFGSSQQHNLLTYVVAILSHCSMVAAQSIAQLDFPLITLEGPKAKGDQLTLLLLDDFFDALRLDTKPQRVQL